MTKKSLNKLLSVILTLAICFTTVFGCFITASATDGSTAEDCDHVFDIIGCTPVQEEPVDGYYVYKDVPCEKCGAVNEYQVVPATEFKKVIYWDGSTKTEPTTEDAEGNILITSAAELAYLASNTVSGNYKIADGIDVIVLQPEATVTAAGGLKKLMGLTDYNQTKDYFEKGIESGITFSKWGNLGIFQGTFDGNGVEIYGLTTSDSSDGAGLFPTVYQGTTVKNLTVKNSYVLSKDYTGALVGKFAVTSKYKSDATTDMDNNEFNSSVVSTGVISFDKVVVSGCYLQTKNWNIMHVGVLCGGNADDKFIPISITNCLVYANIGVSTTTPDIEAGLFGIMSGSWSGDQTPVAVPNGKFENIISLDSVPYMAKPTNQCTKREYYKNVYTNVTSELDANLWYNMSEYYDKKNSDGSSRIVLINKSDVKGPAAQGILEILNDANGSTVWKIDQNSGYPTPVAIGKTTTSQPELNLLATNIDYKENGTFNFNFYYENKYDIGAPTLFVGRADGTGFTELSGTQVDPTVDANDKIFEDAGINLEETKVYKYTIDNISARELGETLLPTAVLTNGESTAYGKTEAISLSKYAKAVFENADASIEDKNAAAALVNYGAAAKDVLNTVNTEATDTIYWNDWQVSEDENSIDELNDTDASGNSWDDPIIIDNADELFWLCRVSTYNDTTNKYFKIADNIKNIILATENVIDGEKIMAMTDAEEIGEYLNSLNEGKGWNWNGDNGSFNGNFDGNGATIYGMRSNALFGTIDCGVRNEENYYQYYSNTYHYDNVGTVIKNINIKNSYYHNRDDDNVAVGGIVAKTCGIADGEKVAGVISFENCSVTNSYFTGAVYGGTLPNGNVGARAGNIGAFIGAATDHDIYRINNCITYGNKISITNTNTDIKDANGNFISVIDKVAVAGSASDRFYVGENNIANKKARLYNTVTNSIVLDNVTPYTLAWAYSSAWTPSFSNVYTDQSLTFHSGVEYDKVMTPITDRDSVKGTVVETTCPNLDWDSEWIIDARGGYPSPVQRATSAGKTIYWQGDAGSETTLDAVNDTGASGASWENAIIIDNAEELYWVLRQAGVDNTVGKYFKIADGIDRIVLQPKGVLELDELLACKDGAAVQTYFNDLKEAGKEFKSWAAGGNSRAVFDGNIDGNGVEILGLYTESAAGDDKVGFIGAWDGGKPGTWTDSNNDGKVDRPGEITVNIVNSGITVKNFTVGYSYMVSARRLGVFGAQSQGDTYGAYVKGILELDTCAVINCYLKNTDYTFSQGEVGVVTGECSDDVVKMNNMLVYGNNATDKSGTALRLKGGVLNSLEYEKGKFVYNTVTNSLVLGTDPFVRTAEIYYRVNEKACFKNLYTDAEILQIAGNVLTDDNAKKVDPAELIGSKAQGIVDKLNGDNGTTWYIGNEYDGIPSLKPATILPTAIQKAYNSLKLTQYDNYGTSDLDFGVYTTNINLKNNPYMGITFALNGEYKLNRHKVDIKISTVDANEVETVIRDTDNTNNITDMNLPAFGEGEEIIDLNGWTNKKNAGRYHLYTLKDLPVSDMCKSLKITMSYTDDAGTKTVEAVISLEGFGCYKQNQYLATGNEYYAKCAEAAKALVYYSQALDARFGANS